MNLIYKMFDIGRCFGVEMEIGAEISADKIVKKLQKHTKRHVEHSPWRQMINNNKWIIKMDASCSALRRTDDYGLEIVSYKACQLDDLDEFSRVATAAGELGCLTNKNCGLHYHVEVKDFSKSQMGILLSNWLNIENVMFQAVPPRRRTSKYCKNILPSYSYLTDSVMHPLNIWTLLTPNAGEATANFRNRSINLLNYAAYLNGCKKNVTSIHRPTVEFRFPEGTLDPACIRNWAIVLIHFVEECSKRNNRPIHPVENIDDFLNILGLNGDKDNFYIFDNNLMNARIWLLGRIASLGDKNWRNLAKQKLDTITN